MSERLTRERDEAQAMIIHPNHVRPWQAKIPVGTIIHFRTSRLEDGGWRLEFEEGVKFVIGMIIYLAGLFTLRWCVSLVEVTTGEKIGISLMLVGLAMALGSLFALAWRYLP